MTQKEIADTIVSQRLPVDNVSLHEQGSVGGINLGDTEMAALRLEWRFGQEKLSLYLVFSNEVTDAMSVPKLADYFYDSAGFAPKVVFEPKTQLLNQKSPGCKMARCYRGGSGPSFSPHHLRAGGPLPGPCI
jgi:hypothetical protein